MVAWENEIEGYTYYIKLEKKLSEVQDAIDYIDRKQTFYDDVLAGKIDYYSNLINPADNCE